MQQDVTGKSEPAPTSLEQTMGITFNDRARLRNALIHSSYSNENPASAPESNERLEFLGDAVLNLVIAEKLFQTLPDDDEGKMSKLRSHLVSRQTLARLARGIKLGQYLYLGKGEDASGGRKKTANLANALESVIAAIFLDRGLATAKDFILSLFADELDWAVQGKDEINYKSRLQEVVLAQRQSLPRYRVVATSGPDHNRCFTVEVLIDGGVLGQGSGRSKKEAETEAARAALAGF